MDKLEPDPNYMRLVAHVAARDEDPGWGIDGLATTRWCESGYPWLFREYESGVMCIFWIADSFDSTGNKVGLASIPPSIREMYIDARMLPTLADCATRQVKAIAALAAREAKR